MIIGMSVFILIYILIGIILVSREGWADDWATNLKLFFIAGLLWPYVLFHDWYVNKNPTRLPDDYLVGIDENLKGKD